MDILFFLGSGVSYKSGLPDTKTITDNLLNEDWWSHTDRNFYRGQNSNEYFRKYDITPKLQSLLKYIKEYSDKYYKGRYKTKPNLEANYEDIFFIVKQVHDELTGEIDNPAIKFFIEHLQDKFQFGTNPDFSYFDKPQPMDEIFWRAEDFINCVVWQSLPIKTKPVGFDLILNFIKSNDYEVIDIATVNHDLLTEEFLMQNNVDFTDGFTNPDGDFCYFNPTLYRNEGKKVNLYKLHGSNNWYRLRNYDKKTNSTTDFYAKVLRNHFRCQNAKGEHIGSTLEHYPIFLTGTINKLADYNFGIVRDVHLKFDEVLFKHNIIIMSGYGWNDKGINGRLMEWILSSQDRKLILLHENPESLRKSKSAMWHRYDDLVKWGRLIPVRKYMCDTTIKDIMPYLN